MAIPVISVSQMRDWEKATWSAGRTPQEVISRVGKILADRLLQLSSQQDVILILCGKGHNGDDARAAASNLHSRNVIQLDVKNPELDLPKLNAIFEGRQPNWILDGLFGIGLNRPLNPQWQTFIRAINESEIPVLSVDAPSGIDADSGEVRGAAIRASITLTLGAPKRGLLADSALPFVGNLEVAPEIGLVACPHSSDLYWACLEDFCNFPPRRIVATHKGTYGHVAIIAGSLGYHGAAILAARGALRAQPGLVSVFTPANVYQPIASQLQAAMVHPWTTSRDFPNSCSAILLGPGLAAKDLPNNLKRELIEIWVESPLPVVADASALDWLPPGGNFEKKIRVITPHPGEAGRMLSISTAGVQSDRPAALRKLSARFGNCIVLLKGNQSLIGRATGEMFVNSSGNPFLAQGGSGDVLAGFISGFLAQPRLQQDVVKTVRFAAWRHGVAADELCRSQPNWTIEELVGIL